MASQNAADAVQLPRWRRWSQQIISFGITQTAVQLLTAASGILLVRMLAKSEYSFYTIANSVQALLINLTDIGIGTGLLSIGGRTFNLRSKMGSLLQCALAERRRLALPISFAAVGILIALLAKAGSHLGQIASLIILIFVCFLFQYQTSVFAVALRLHQQVGKMQRVEVAASALRLGLTFSLLYFYPVASVGILAVGLALVMQFGFYKKWTYEVADLSQAYSPEFTKELRAIMWAMAPNVLFQCFQGQIPIFLLSIMGRANTVADFGAISRLAMLFAVFGALNMNIMHPTFARLQGRKKMVHGFWAILCLNLVVGAGFVGLSMLFPKPLLWLLGSKYGDLEHELVLAVTGSALTLLSGGIWGMAAARGWVQHSWLYIPATICGQVTSIFILDLSTVKGVLLFNIVGQIFSNGVFLFIVYRGFRTYKPRSSRN